MKANNQRIQFNFEYIFVDITLCLILEYNLNTTNSKYIDSLFFVNVKKYKYQISNLQVFYIPNF
jgi:hypothetical protein